jgi:glycosyltransferase involved in cell wall biosynthesis
MRIVHLVISGDVAGGQVVALQLARAARARGDEVSFVAPEHGAFVDLAGREGFPVELLDVRRTIRLGAAWRLRRLLREQGADVLHTHTQVAPNVLGRIAARLAGTAAVSHLHIENYFRPQRIPRAVLRALDNATARLCARVIAVSEDTRRALVEQGYPARLIDVVPNGIELDGTRETGDLRLELGIPVDAPVVGEVARLCDVKGQRELIEALARLPGAQLVLVGRDLEQGGAYQARLEREAERLGVRERVHFAGFRPDAADLLGQLDVFALPSWTEGLPVTILEAMARRRAVVATSVGGTPELVADGETGLLVPPRDSGALADALGRLLEDPELRARMGEAGYRRVADRFAADTMTRRVLEVYDEIAASR